MYYEKFMNRVHKSSGWASDEDFAASQGCLRGLWGSRPQEGGVVLYSQDGEVIVDGGDECRHVLVIGATGTGKSRLIIMPSLLYSLRAQEKRSFVVFDVKGELRAATERVAADNGFTIRSINFRDPSDGNAWNPFCRANRLYAAGDAKSRKMAWKLVEDMIDSIFRDPPNGKIDPFWRTNSANLFRGICTLLWEQGRNLTLLDVLRLSDSIPADKDDDYRCELFTQADRCRKASTVHRLLAGFRAASNQTRGNIVSSYRGYLAPMTARDDVLEMVSSDATINFQELGTTPTVLYIVLPDDTTALGALQSMLLTQLMQEMNECAMKHGGRMPIRTEMYLDEVCNIKPAIPSLETALTIARSRGIRYILAIQSYAQLYGVYGAAAETIAANCSSWIALNIAKDETFRTKLSQLCGSNAVGDPLITPSQLSLLKYEQAIVIRERCAPYFTQLEDVSSVQERLPQPLGRSRSESPSRPTPQRQRRCA